MVHLSFVCSHVRSREENVAIVVAQEAVVFWPNCLKYIFFLLKTLSKIYMKHKYNKNLAVKGVGECCNALLLRSNFFAARSVWFMLIIYAEVCCGSEFCHDLR